MKHGCLEVCVDSLESAVIASQAGADRLELCSNLCIGGTTPSEVLYEKIREAVNCPIHVLIRPRFGDFCYSKQEQEIMLEEIKRFVSAGADGIVTGALMPEGILNLELMKQVREMAGDRKLTLHRAFDMTRDPEEALDMAGRLGVQIILTSGQADNCEAGVECLSMLSTKAGDQLTMMAGGGIRSRNIEQLHLETGITCFHMSGKKIVDSLMKYRKNEVHMGLPSLSEYERYQTDPEEIKMVKEMQENWN